MYSPIYVMKCDYCVHADEGDDINLSALAPTPLREDEQRRRDSMPELVIWGTTIVAENVRNVFGHFLSEFRLPRVGGRLAGEDNLAFYQQAIEIMHRTGEMILNLNCAHLFSFPPTRTLYFDLRKYPQEVIPIMDRVVQEVHIQCSIAL